RAFWADRDVLRRANSSRPPPESRWSKSIADGKACSHVRGPFDLIEHGDREVLERNLTFPRGGNEQLVRSKPESAGALSGVDVRRRTEHGPVEVCLSAHELESIPRGERRLFPLRGKIRSIDELHAWRYLEAARAADEEEAFDACRLRCRHDRLQPAAVMLAHVGAGMAAEGAD